MKYGKKKKSLINWLPMPMTCKDKAEADREKMDKKKAKLEEEYREQLQVMLDEKQAEAKAIIRSLRQEKSGPVHKQTELLHSLNTMNPSAPVSQKAEPLKVGDYVQIKDVTVMEKSWSYVKKKQRF